MKEETSPILDMDGCRYHNGYVGGTRNGQEDVHFSLLFSPPILKERKKKKESGWDFDHMMVQANRLHARAQVNVCLEAGQLQKDKLAPFSIY